MRHRRLAASEGGVEHAFSYRVEYLWLDLDELPRVFDGHRLWSYDRPNVACVLRRDLLGDPAVPPAVAVRDLVERRTGRRPEGPVRVLTQPRTCGLGFAPVSLYHCLDPGGDAVRCVVAEITNTPWLERHAYVLASDRTEGVDADEAFTFDKEFHVSPFHAMDQTYRWRLGRPGERLTVHMQNLRGGRPVFAADLALEHRPLTGRALAGTLLRHPVPAARVVAAIYLNALRLWRRGAPVHVHPRKRTTGSAT